MQHYPKYTDPICRAQNDTRFCDLDNLLNVIEVLLVMERMHKFWVENSVHSCPLPGTTRSETYPFNLGVALLRGFPSMKLDDESFDHFGTDVLNYWNMLDDRSCPNGALLIFIKDYNRAFLSKISCEFICKQRLGGQNVTSAMQAPMDDGDLLSAVLDGVANFGG